MLPGESRRRILPGMRYPKRPTSLKVAISRQLRQEATPAEQTVWRRVRNRRLLGLKFRRQHVIDGFIADFYCPSLRLVLEVDGPALGGLARRRLDNARTGLFIAKGLRVARLRNEEVSETALIAAIKRATE